MSMAVVAIQIISRDEAFTGSQWYIHVYPLEPEQLVVELRDPPARKAVMADLSSTKEI